jgi:tripartite-type tricarboxylate transporter receptor subunit TctC
MRHMERLIDGNPTIVVQNMTGAGGLVASNFLGEKAEHDGLTVGFFTWEPLAQVLGKPGMRVPYDAFDFVAGMQSNQMTYIRKDVSPGIATPADLVKADEFRFAGLDVTSTIDLQGRMTLDLLGAKYRYVTGFQGLAKTRAAVVQNEVQMGHASLPSYYGGVKPALIDPGIAIPLYQYGVADEGNGIKRSPGLPDVPTFLELYQQIHGKPADSEHAKMLTQFVRFVVRMNRTVFLPPDSPPEALEALQTAFQRLATDEQFLAEYRKTINTDPVIIFEQEGLAAIQELSAPDPKLVAFIQEYVESAE